MPSSLGNTTIVPSDVNTIDPPARVIFCFGVGGNVSIVHPDMSTTTFAIVPGQSVVANASKVMATGTTAQGLLGTL